MKISICDLCDKHADEVRVADPVFHNYGGRSAFGGEIVTIKCHEDNSLVKEQVSEPGAGKVLVVDGGGSLQRSLLGDQLAAEALKNEWAGIIVYGAIRDVEVIADLDLGVKALNVIPMKTRKRGLGERDVAVRFAGVTFAPGAWVYADLNGVIVADRSLTSQSN